MEESNVIIKIPLKYLIEWAHRLSNSRMMLDGVYNKVDGVIKEELLHNMKDVADCMSDVNVDIRQSCVGDMDRVVGIEEIERSGKEND